MNKREWKRLLKQVASEAKIRIAESRKKKEKAVVMDGSVSECQEIADAIQVLQELHVELGCPGV